MKFNHFNPNKYKLFVGIKTVHRSINILNRINIENNNLWFWLMINANKFCIPYNNNLIFDYYLISLMVSVLFQLMKEFISIHMVLQLCCWTVPSFYRLLRCHWQFYEMKFIIEVNHCLFPLQRLLLYLRDTVWWRHRLYHRSLGIQQVSFGDYIIHQPHLFCSLL